MVPLAYMCTILHQDKFTKERIFIYLYFRDMKQELICEFV